MPARKYDERKELKDKEWLEHQYLVLEKTTDQIAQELHCSKGSVWYALKRTEIPVRSRHSSRQIKERSCNKCGTNYQPTGTSSKNCDDCKKSAPVYLECAADSCSEIFKRIRSGRRYCSEECRYGTSDCVRCGKRFLKRTVMHKGSNKYCSDDCRMASLKEGAKYEYKIPDGYVNIKHPETGFMIGRNRYLMSQLLGRELLATEEVHHINAIRDDDTVGEELQLHLGYWRSGNLELWTTSQPAGARVSDKLQYGFELFQIYLPEVAKLIEPYMPNIPSITLGVNNAEQESY